MIIENVDFILEASFVLHVHYQVIGLQPSVLARCARNGETSES